MSRFNPNLYDSGALRCAIQLPLGLRHQVNEQGTLAWVLSTAIVHSIV